MTLDVRVIPRARRTELAGTRHNAVLIRLAAPPVDGAANVALCRFLADRVGIPLRSITLVSGDTGRDKRLAIAGVRLADVRARLEI